MVSVYNQLGEEKLHEMIDRFYDYVEYDSRMRFLFPEDLSETRLKQKLFQTQFLGGPNLYNQKYGHPMLKMRHMSFRITVSERNAWIDNMTKAMQDVSIPEELQYNILRRYELTADQMVNTK